MTPQFRRAVETYGPRFMADLGLSRRHVGTVPTGLDFPISFPVGIFQAVRGAARRVNWIASGA